MSRALPGLKSWPPTAKKAFYKRAKGDCAARRAAARSCRATGLCLRPASERAPVRGGIGASTPAEFGAPARHIFLFSIFSYIFFVFLFCLIYFLFSFLLFLHLRHNAMCDLVSLLFIAYGLLLVAYCSLLTACSLLLIYRLLLTAHCLLCTAYCLLLTAYCIWLIAYWLLHTACCLLRRRTIR